MSLLINVNLYIFLKSNDSYLCFVIHIKSKIDLNYYSTFFHGKHVPCTCYPNQYWLKKQTREEKQKKVFFFYNSISNPRKIKTLKKQTKQEKVPKVHAFHSSQSPIRNQLHSFYFYFFMKGISFIDSIGIRNCK